MSVLAAEVGCGAPACGARIVAWLFDPGDPGRVPPCPECVAAVDLMARHWAEDWARTLRSASAAVGGGPA